MTIDKQEAEKVLRAAAKAAETSGPPSPWDDPFRKLSVLCQRDNRTHIAFLATALLAKSCDAEVDVFAVKAKTGGDNAYSARGLCHGVIVPCSGVLGIDLGVTGREPLNNQPYFRIDRVSRDIPVHASAKSALNLLCDILEMVATVGSEDDAKEALTEFLRVRKDFAREYPVLEASAESVTPAQLAEWIGQLVSAKSEGGKRAQASAAALMDVYAGDDRVEVTRVNDPDRHIPGDVAVRGESGAWERVYEVRDKPVNESDLLAFARKCLENGVERAGVVAVAQTAQLDVAAALSWCAERGLAMEVYIGWEPFVREVLTWSGEPTFRAGASVVPRVYERLVELEAEPEALEMWNKLVSEAEEPFELR